MKYLLTIILTIIITALAVKAVEVSVNVPLTAENERTTCLADCNYQCNLK
jgi:hypothetical protein